MSFVWLASYPKSGNTWVRILLSNYRSDSGSDWDWDDALVGPSSHLLRHEFDESMGVASADISPAALEKFRREWHRIFAARFPGTSFTKVHEAYYGRFDGEPLFAAGEDCKVIYLVRNPLDLAGSFAHHENRSLDQIIARMADPAAHVLSGETHFDEFMGTWSEHVSGWTDQNEMDTLVVKYEQLVEDTLGTLEEIVRFSGLGWDARKAAIAVEASRFDRMREREARSRFKVRPTEAASFFRRGRVGGWREELTETQAERLLTDHQHLMESMGYL